MEHQIGGNYVRSRLSMDINKFPRIDSHQHFWNPVRGDYGWLTPDKTVLYHQYSPQDLIPYMRQYEIDYCITVQAAPTIEETRFLLKLYNQFEFIGGVVGWIDLDSNEFTSQFESLVECEGFIGIRPMIQDLPNEWILQPRVINNLKILADYGFPIDLQARPRHLPVLTKLFQHVPNLRAVIDHIAKPFIAAGTKFPWDRQLIDLASFEGVYCKLSGLITEGNINGGYKQFLPYIEHVIETFGYERLMFGSDWPVCLDDGSYEDVWNIVTNALPASITEMDLANLYGGTAKKFYG